MLPIVFGYPMPETFAAAERGELAIGGCLVSGEDPTHRCTACDQDVILDDLGEVEPIVLCTTCDLPLDGDPDEELDGNAGLPICGACRRNREFAAIEEVALWSDSDE
jgi:hypothetical protein